MKSKTIIISFLVIAQIGAFKLKSHGQYSNRISNVVLIKNDTIWEAKPILLADETTLNYNKTKAIIQCDNETIFKRIYETHSQLFKQFTYKWKHSKHGNYKRYTIYIDRADADILINWAKSHL
jgi:hypothetical protein